MIKIKMKKEIDVLIVARPDHSMLIYKALLRQHQLKFKYLSFKIFPKWIKRLTGSKKMTVVSKNAICSWYMTVVYFCKYCFRFSFARNWDKKLFFDSYLKHFLKKKEIRVIHYWPEHVNVEVANYLKTHPNTFAIADIHMPHPMIAYDYMVPIYEKYHINPESTELFTLTKTQGDLAKGVTDILVPSSYVADTYRQIYGNNKNYHIIPYGVMASPLYYKRKRSVIKEFVYAGRISLEKGADILLDFFKNHPELNIHLYGGVNDDQKAIFDKYTTIPNIYFHGHVPKAELQERMCQCDVGIHLSRFDAYSLAVGEMIGVGLPVIVSCNTGIKDDVIKYNFGCVAELNLEGVSIAIQTMIDNYNVYINSIDNYLRTQYISYGDAMVDFYRKLIKSQK